MPDWRSLEARLHLKFKNPTLLKQALIHTSYLNENPGIDVGSNERLEFSATLRWASSWRSSCTWSTRMSTKAS